MENHNKCNKKCILEDVRSRYILKIIFDYLQEYKLLKIIHYNKNLQNKLNKDINNYKNCQELK